MPAVNIANLDSAKYTQLKNRHLNPNLPKAPWRGIFTAQSSGGKTNALVNLLLRNDFPFDRLYIICPNVHFQPKYLMLKDIMEELDESVKKETLKKVAEYNRKHKKQIDESSLEFEPIAQFHDTVPLDLLDTLDKDKMNLVVFDDLVLANKDEQKIIDSLYVKGRHKNCSVVQLVQSFYRASRISRLQCNLFIIFHSTSKSELVKLHKEMGLNIDKKTFVDTIMEKTLPQYSFVVIDLDHEVPFRCSDFTTNLFA